MGPAGIGPLRQKNLQTFPSHFWLTTPPRKRRAPYHGALATTDLLARVRFTRLLPGVVTSHKPSALVTR
jgi:hypothetical protein